MYREPQRLDGFSIGLFRVKDHRLHRDGEVQRVTSATHRQRNCELILSAQRQGDRAACLTVHCFDRALIQSVLSVVGRYVLGAIPTLSSMRSIQAARRLRAFFVGGWCTPTPTYWGLNSPRFPETRKSVGFAPVGGNSCNGLTCWNQPAG